MREAGRGVGLALEAALGHELAGEDLDRDIALQALVARHPHRPEAARAQAPAQAVALEDDRAGRLVGRIGAGLGLGRIAGLGTGDERAGDLGCAGAAAPRRRQLARAHEAKIRGRAPRPCPKSRLFAVGAVILRAHDPQGAELVVLR